MNLSDMRSFKDNGDPAMRLVVAIRDETGRLLGELHCLDRALAEEDGLAGDLTEWRNAARTSFLTQFEARVERTASWLQNVVLSASDRVLFIVRGIEGERLGHIGISNIAPGRAEVDNVMRGRPGGEKSLMFYSAVALIAWMFRRLAVPVVQLHVFSNNTAAIRLYERLGFEIVERSPLRRIEEPEMVRYATDGEEGVEVDFGYLRMEIPVARFHALHPWAPVSD
ncbi:GNAT family N-acetyltransferase [Rhizobium terrae]|uniref:GNAT family N-acetyltransferase n=1 Tax=Rhizobium terrae TaxID=2171756 RepID=UPI000E3DAB53|nr:GNAT family N-acetyltransferase [Rhizobium terrae]